jgi:hypothetical protein
MTNIFDYPLHTQISGLYAEPFYTSVELEPFELRENPDYLEIPEFLVQKEYREYTGQTRKHIDFDNLSSKDEDIYYECKHNLTDAALMLNSAWRPRIYNEEIADLCDLIPFTIDKGYTYLELLSLGGCGMNMTYKLEAYMLLVSNSYDEDGYFAEKGISYFENYYGAGSKVVKEIAKLIKC